MKTREQVQAEINALRGVHGFAAADDDAAEKVLAGCTGVAALHPGGVAAIPIATIIALVMQVLPIIFGPDGFTIEKFLAVLQMILGIFK